MTTDSLPRPSEIGWHDIPTEIIEQILCHADGPSLLAFLKVSHSLHHLALKQLLGPRVMRELSTKSQVILHDGQMTQCTRALCIALSLPIRLSRIAYFLTHHNMNALLDDLQTLLSLITRVHLLSTFQLRISLCDLNELDAVGERNLLTLSDGQLLKKRLTRLIDLALAKGCQSMTIEGDALLPYPLNIKPRALSRLERFAERTLSPMFQSVSRKKPLPTRLQSLTISDGKLLTVPLADYTKELMGRSSATLHSLEVKFIWPRASRTHEEWSLFFGDAVHLPALQTLILAGEDLVLGPHTFESFLSRHGTIKKLKLDLSFKYMSATDHIPRFTGSAILPQLRSLSARPQLVSWLLQRPESLLRNERWYQSLESVCILSPPRDRYPIDASVVDRAILSLALCMNFEDEFWVGWVRGHANAARGNRSGGSSLVKAGITELTIEVLSPLLRELEISGEPFPLNPSLTQRLCQEITSCCPRLQRVEHVNRKLPEDLP